MVEVAEKPELTFRESDHTYWLGSVKVPGVTTILKVLGGYEGIPARILKKASERGTAIHTMTEYDDDDTLDVASLDDEMLGYLQAYWRFKEEMRPEMLDAEVRDYHPTLKFAGTRDRRLILRGKVGILDVKSCYRLMPSTGPQTAAYQGIYNANAAKADQAKHRWGLKLAKDGTYELQEYKGPEDWNTFVSCLNCWRFIEQNNKKLLANIEDHRFDF